MFQPLGFFFFWRRIIPSLLTIQKTAPEFLKFQMLVIFYTLAVFFTKRIF